MVNRLRKYFLQALRILNSLDQISDPEGFYWTFQVLFSEIDQLDYQVKFYCSSFYEINHGKTSINFFFRSMKPNTIFQSTTIIHIYTFIISIEEYTIVCQWKTYSQENIRNYCMVTEKNFLIFLWLIIYFIDRYKRIVLWCYKTTKKNILVRNTQQKK